MKIDEENSFGQSMRDYHDYCKEQIDRVDDTCDSLINKLLFYKYILKSDFTEKELMKGVISNNINDMINDITHIEDSDFLKEITEYLESTKTELSWKDFENGKLNKEMLREYKLFKLMKK